MFAQLISTLKKSPKTIVFTEGTDPRILEASARLLSGNFLKPVLVGNPDEIAAAAEDIGFNIRGAEIIDPENYDGIDEMVDEMVELRKGKMTADECRAALKKSNYFGTMLVKMGKADCLLGGATYSTADTVRPALQLFHLRHRHRLGRGILPPQGQPRLGLQGLQQLVHLPAVLRLDLHLPAGVGHHQQRLDKLALHAGLHHAQPHPLHPGQGHIAPGGNSGQVQGFFAQPHRAERLCPGQVFF